ncbi:MAG: hypothetical protein FWG44_08200 [Oscillospiraceae bacterium]|nr:hypothetical protein [Oscillospiraceae bacterium]
MLQQISTFVENKSGRLCAVMKALNEAKINIRALSIADTTDFGIVRLIVDDTEKALGALKEQGFTATVTEVIGFKIEDHFGAMFGVVNLFSDEGINIEYSYSLMGKNQGEADIVVRVTEKEKATEILTKNNIKLITANDV